MKIKNKIQAAFFIVLIVYLVTLGSVAYVSVYFAYIVVLILVVSGIIVVITKDDHQMKS